MKLPTLRKKTSGFTLIELLIVIAVIGVLAAILLAVINPLEQLSRGRDSGRSSTVKQLGDAVTRYFTTNNAYPAVGASWITTLVTAGEVQNAPTNPTPGTYSAGCAATTGQNNYCYTTDTTNAIVYVRVEASSNKNKCTDPNNPIAWFVWSSAAGRAGITCTASASTTPGLTGLTFVN